MMNRKYGSKYVIHELIRGISDPLIKYGGHLILAPLMLVFTERCGKGTCEADAPISRKGKPYPLYEGLHLLHERVRYLTPQ